MTIREVSIISDEIRNPFLTVTANKFPGKYIIVGINYAELAYGLRVWSVLLSNIRVWVRVKARAL